MKKGNVYIKNNVDGVCTIITNLSKVMPENKKLKIWETDSRIITPHCCEVKIDNDDGLIEYLSQYLIYYNSGYDAERVKKGLPIYSDYDGYFYTYNYDTFERVPLTKKIIQYYHPQIDFSGKLCDHSQDCRSLNMRTNLNIMSWSENLGKLRRHDRKKGN